MHGAVNFDRSQKKREGGDKAPPAHDFSMGMTKGLERRSEVKVLLLHLGIRLRYLVESWFFLKPIFASRQAAILCAQDTLRDTS